ncbi:Adaptor protein complex AP-3 delta subunit [Pluteus cervinus]|uniref:Adaptor protein complex AP-3 delta subunit n=1 Tax=Pluteus cervinus TaxID=181527 RepID=A0ACD3ART2_9AGAR|nr:Adaptor protein complex AP-3 delta subunit [Pluteus cervinus]
MWERTLQDLIRGLRANKKDESKFIAKAVDEIRSEIKGEDMELKAGAVLKLTYLEMLGYDMSWASFHVVEVMSSPRSHLKSVGYLAAGQSFNEDTDVLMLTTNLLKKDLSSTPADVAVTLNGLANIITSDLARDLAPELVAMLNHSRPAIRKRAVLTMYKVLMKYPEAAASARPRLVERLEDADQGVIAATANVLCELGRRRPQDYLTLAPQLFHILTTASNNWLIIKIVKLFGFMTPHEPRLVKKLQPPITDLISTTPAISLLYECVHTCIIGGMLQGTSGSALAKTCVTKLAAFLQDEDQNLKYIALLALTKIVPTHPYLLAEYQDVVLACVNDQDISIRMRALDLVCAMVNRDNLQSIVQQVLSHLVPETSSTMQPTASQSLAQHAIPVSPTNPRPALSPNQSPAYRLVLSQHILEMCSQNTYDNITNFEWYISVLVDLAHVANVDIGAEIRDQLVDVVARVKAARRYAVKLMYTLLTDETFLQNAQEEGSCKEVLWAAAWICGEHCRELTDPQQLLPYFFTAEVSHLTPDIIAVYIQAATKIFGYWAAELAERWDNEMLPELKEVVEAIVESVTEFSGSTHIEVQERAANALQLFKFIQADINTFQPKPYPNSGFSVPGPSSSFDPIPPSEPHFPKSLYLIQPLFNVYDLNPVARQAQASVPIPEGLDLDAWIVPPPPEPEPEAEPSEPRVKKSKKGKEKEGVNGTKTKGSKKKKDAEQLEPQDVLIPDQEETQEERALREKRKAERLAQLKDDPYYIIDDRSPPPTREDFDSIPVVKLEGMPSLQSIHDNRLPSLKPLPISSSVTQFVIEKEGEMPAGAVFPLLSSSPASRPQTTEPVLHLAAPVPLSSFPQYEVPDDIARTVTPEPVKVVRTKKKGTGKKKRTTDAS